MVLVSSWWARAAAGTSRTSIRLAGGGVCIGAGLAVVWVGAGVSRSPASSNTRVLAIFAFALGRMGTRLCPPMDRNIMIPTIDTSSGAFFNFLFLYKRDDWACPMMLR